MSPELSRRTLLGSAAGAAMLSALPLSVQTALAAPPSPAGWRTSSTW
ncbi:hypothetical protein QMK19_05865 [Streptomyces sp. H10-C2]|nr:MULTISPECIES: hypothetical protein [unclassified Streptomyces]MDJ0340146.1 hypothetical protein [Streptomyces sp. PH10-H1]MDJ0369217.1 hypothetical protein [Streptomyces sp. H10-C2]